MLLLIMGCSGSAEEGNANSKEKYHPRRMVTRENLFGLEAYGRDDVWVVGFEGTIFHSGNGGLKWERQRGAGNTDLYDIFFINSQKGWIVGKFGTILNTTDGGKNWVRQETGTRERLFDVFFIDENCGWVVGTMGTILHTENGGERWIKQGQGEDRYYNGVFFVDDKKKLPEDWEDLSVLEFDTEILNSPFKKIDGNDYTFRSYIQSYKAKGIILLGVEEGEEDHFISPNKEYAISVISPDSAWIKDKWDTFWHPDEIVDFKTHTNTIAISSKDYAKDVLKCKIIVPNADDKDFDDNKND